MKILVTGAQGYIGCGVVKQLLKKGHRVVATDIGLQKYNFEAEYIDVNIFEIENPYIFFNKPDVMLHLAWRDGFKHSSNAHIDDLHKHYHFIERMITAGLRQVCVMGSVHEVGFFEGAVKDSTPTKPQSLYGISKDALRNAIELVAKNNETIFQWIRGYYIVGNTEMGCSIFSKITEAEKKGQKEFPFTEGKNQFDFIDYEEFCEQIVSVVEQTEVNGVINCCSGYPQSIGGRVEKFIKDNNYNIKLMYGTFPDRPYDSKAIWGDNSKICKIMES